MIIGIFIGKRDNDIKVKRFHVVMNTPVGAEARLVEAGIKLPSLIDAGLVDDSPEQLDTQKIEQFYEQDCQDKFFGPQSNIELRREKGFEWYYPGFVKITLSCFTLVFLTWLITKLLFVWGK
jgi:hypothetical protein